ncbi:MAG TPA: CocE/NonD family hydrolase [Candidatus Thermoplasmatota archaeon]|nr:CocE/NonD family hydrolase [Candidatus Thermoplasmatota archaeon]
MRPGGPLVLALALALLAAGCVLPAATNVQPAAALPAGGFTRTAVYPGEYDTSGKLSRVLVAGPFGILDPQMEVLASEADGAAIPVGYALPDVPEGTRVPVIVLASPYFFEGVAPAGFAKDGNYARLVENFVPHGYAVAFLPVRGTADHGGCMDLMGPLERADLNQAITWLGEQPWSNGRVGMVGVSYDGSTPWEVAGAGNPYLKTIVPISGVNDLYTLMYGSGVSEFRGAAVLNALYYEYGFLEYNAVTGTRSPQHMLEGALCPESLKGIAISLHSAASGERDPLGFWAARNSRPLVEENYRGSIFLVHGLQDWNVDPRADFPWVPTLEEKGITVKYLLSQTGHAWPDSRRNDVEKAAARWDWAEMLLRWFDRELKGDATADPGPKAQVQDSSGQWRMEDAWPPRDAVPTLLHLASGKLAGEPGASGSVLVGGADPGFGPVECPLCARFAGETLEQELRFSGIPRLRVNVTPTAPAGQLAAWLYAEEGGKLQRVGWGAVDLRFPQGGEKASPVVPGQRVAVDLAFEALDVVVPAGGSLVLVLHTDGYADHLGNPAPLRVQVGEGATLELPVIERDGSTFFQPPGTA